MISIRNLDPNLDIGFVRGAIAPLIMGAAAWNLGARRWLNCAVTQTRHRRTRAAWLLPLLALIASPALAEKKYGPGVTDTEIKIGQTMPYSGPVSAFGTMGRAETAYFEMVNAAGGVNGRKIRLLSLDDGYSPPRTIEQTRKLVESDEVLLLFSSFGTPPNTAAMKYLNAKGVPQLFIAATGMKWGDPRNFPWTMAFLPSQRTGTAGYVQYLLKNRLDAKIAVLNQNDDFGKDYVRALRDHLGARAETMIVAEASYEST
ncbi:MAG: ABC transporter substrate-binding protein, partial [Burkholderiales bacterium]